MVLFLLLLSFFFFLSHFFFFFVLFVSFNILFRLRIYIDVSSAGRKKKDFYHFYATTIILVDVPRACNDHPRS